MDNTKCYAKLCSKIGLAMILFYSFFTLSTVAVASVEELFSSEILSENGAKLVVEIIVELCYAAAYFLSFSAAAFILRKMCKNLPCHRPIYTSFNIKKWVLPAILAVIAINFTLSLVNNVMISSLSPSLISQLIEPSEMEGKPLYEIVIFFFLSIISTAVVPALCEEYLFRGGVLTEMLPFGKSTAIFASSFLFGLMHQNPFQFLYTMIMGIAIGYIYVKSKSIWACVLLHFLNNLVTVIEEYIPLITNEEWLVYIFDLLIIFGGAAVIIIFVKKDKQPSIEENGGFGVICERGMDSEELVLEIPYKQKIRRFFSRPTIIFIVICMLSIVAYVLSLFGLPIALLG